MDRNLFSSNLQIKIREKITQNIVGKIFTSKNILLTFLDTTKIHRKELGKGKKVKRRNKYNTYIYIKKHLTEFEFIKKKQSTTENWQFFLCRVIFQIFSSDQKSTFMNFICNLTFFKCFFQKYSFSYWTEKSL